MGYGRNHWESVYGPQNWRETDIRGSFHLAIPFEDLDDVWYLVQKATAKGQLGYMSSLSPGPMTFGQLKGNWTISLHTIHGEMEKIYRSLNRFRIFHYAFKYDLIKKFRHRYYNVAEFYNGYQPVYLYWG